VLRRYARYTGRGKVTALGAATGAVTALVAITPACGFVTPMWALFLGFFAVLCVFFIFKCVRRQRRRRGGGR
jgi:ammonia channel protein AmtB